MEQTKKKYKELNGLVSSINNVIGKQETKVQKKLFKIYEKVKSHHESYNAQRDELRLDNAATDEKGILLTDEKGEYKFNKEGVKKLTKDIEALNEKEFEFKPIEVINTNGLELFTFLEDWTTGITFVKEEEVEL
jgi:hypothetical protein